MKAREFDQSPTVIKMLESMYLETPEDVDPIVLVEDEILDGHHRARAAENAGVEPAVCGLSLVQYEALRAAGYDDMEVAAAAQLAAGHDSAADNLNMQFPGCNLLDRAFEALDLLS